MRFQTVVLTAVYGLLVCATVSAQQQASGDTTAAARILYAPVVLKNAPQQHAIEHSDAYYTRLTIHRIGSYTMLPLMAAEYWLGNKLINGDDVKGPHVAVATALGGLFAVNTVTGVWNLVDARKDPGAARRIIHAALMLASDAGMVYTASIAGEAGERFEFEEGGFSEGDGANRHRNAALASFGLAGVGTVLMWLWKD
jgi:hypothetical protein